MHFLKQLLFDLFIFLNKLYCRRDCNEDQYPDWQRGNIEQAIKIIEDEEETYLDFPLRDEYHEYELVEEFIGALSDDEVREELFEAEKHWYEFKENKIKELVIEWCEVKGLLVKE